MLYSQRENVKDTRVREYILPQKIIKTFGKIENEKVLLNNRQTQIDFNNFNVAKITNDGEKTGILLDFGFEFCGSVSVSVYNIVYNINKIPCAKIRLSFGESVNEALSALGEKNSVNDHNARDFIVDVPRMSTNIWGNTGYRFLYIELLSECTVQLTSIQGVCVYKPYEFIGSFNSDDETLNNIYNTAVHTCHMCMQDQIWDGIKRDRLVWIGDLNPELKTIKYVFGDVPDVEDSLDFSSKFLSGDNWVNRMPTYSLWWIINAEEWCSYFKKTDFLLKNKTVINLIVKQILDKCDEEGVFSAGDFIDWPTYQLPVAKVGVKVLTMMFYKAVANMKQIIKPSLYKKCLENTQKLQQVKCNSMGYKQISALLLLNEMADKESIGTLKDGTVKGFSTFMSYYIYSALAIAEKEENVIKALKNYYGAMLSFGATTFWEDFDIEWTENACRIDEICPKNKKDIHGDNGRYCYEGFRHSLCHGWASGPVAFMTEYILGIKTDFSNDKIILEPHISNLKFVEGSIATPYGKFFVKYNKDENGNIITEYDAPKEIEVIKNV